MGHDMTCRLARSDGPPRDCKCVGEESREIYQSGTRKCAYNARHLSVDYAREAVECTGYGMHYVVPQQLTSPRHCYKPCLVIVLESDISGDHACTDGTPHPGNSGGQRQSMDMMLQSILKHSNHIPSLGLACKTPKLFSVPNHSGP